MCTQDQETALFYTPAWLATYLPAMASPLIPLSELDVANQDTLCSPFTHPLLSKAPFLCCVLQRSSESRMRFTSYLPTTYYIRTYPGLQSFFFTPES